jgi:hypothetical protein
MKSRELKTTYNLIATDYKIEPIVGGRFRHSFHPKTTDKIYEFEANGSPEIEEGQRYNIGYRVSDGRNIIEPSSLSKSDEVNPTLSYLYSREISQSKSVINKQKNDDRVACDKSDGYYWGPKYAWREYGLAIPQSAFRAYLDEIGHPKSSCVITNPDDLAHATNTEAYADAGLEEAVSALIESATKKTKVQYTSPLYSKRFAIKGIAAMTDKK